MHTREVINTEASRQKRKFSIKEANKSSRAGFERARKIISAPTNFNHISHMGPEIQNQMLIDLPSPASSSENNNARLTTMQQAARSTNTVRLTSLRSLTGSKKQFVPSRYPSSLSQSPQNSSGYQNSLDCNVKQKSLSRQSVTSNHSSSTPPSPNRLSSSYDS